MRHVMVSGLLLVLPWTVAAEPADCANAADQATLNQCADAAFRTSDAELNALYQQIQQRLQAEAGTGKLLTAAQRAWVGFRDAECRFSASGVLGGSIYPTIYSGCADQLTQKRIKDFKAYLSCQDGDMSCPVPKR